MAPRAPHPRSNEECIALLETLGFKRKIGTGRGKHPIKYLHPSKDNIREGERPFVLITHQFIPANGLRLMKNLENWDFTPAQIKQALQGIAPDKAVDSETDIDIEPEAA